MRDPGEGVAADGTITTGVARSRVPQPFEPVLSTAVEAIAEAGRDASAYLYGSVATGQARPAQSDVDLLTVGLDPGLAAGLGRELSSHFGGLCRGVEIAAATRDQPRARRAPLGRDRPRSRARPAGPPGLERRPGAARPSGPAAHAGQHGPAHHRGLRHHHRPVVLTSRPDP
ncbi:MAG: nucleotidyltransferase domain-containing protein [Actinomycetota bacterium]|nr:nucleotidyltransferase domain-containing protein [Actinomycetota bacterium]